MNKISKISCQDFQRRSEKLTQISQTRLQKKKKIKKNVMNVTDEKNPFILLINFPILHTYAARDILCKKSANYRETKKISQEKKKFFFIFFHK